MCFQYSLIRPLVTGTAFSINSMNSLSCFSRRVSYTGHSALIPALLVAKIWVQECVCLHHVHIASKIYFSLVNDTWILRLSSKREFHANWGVLGIIAMFKMQLIDPLCWIKWMGAVEYTWHLPVNRPTFNFRYDSFSSLSPRCIPCIFTPCLSHILVRHSDALHQHCHTFVSLNRTQSKRNISQIA